ncbi:Uncharacterized protein Fot_42566 [Forsythia ovata]|uniref:Uncharacterized protein n=1 Tax=Forsythia ovata TaxID=205694 RepID=A0ABD1RLJ7_9LAMI
MASQPESSCSLMFTCLISAICLVEEVTLLSHEEPESPINKWTIGSSLARRAAENPALTPALATETNRLIRQVLTHLVEQGSHCHNMKEKKKLMKSSGLKANLNGDGQTVKNAVECSPQPSGWQEISSVLGGNREQKEKWGRRRSDA